MQRSRVSVPPKRCMSQVGIIFRNFQDYCPKHNYMTPYFQNKVGFKSWKFDFHKSTRDFSNCRGCSKDVWILCESIFLFFWNKPTKIAKNHENIDVIATYLHPQHQKMHFFETNNERNLKILLAQHFWYYDIPIVDGRPRIKIAVFCAKFQFSEHQMPTTKIFILKMTEK